MRPILRKFPSNYLSMSQAPVPFRCHYARLDSTQAEMKRLIRDYALPDACVITAAEQTNGRGRNRDARWASEAGNNALFSMFIRLNKVLSPASLYQSAGLAVVNVLNERYGVETALKYPNDVIYDGKKLAGVLIDTHMRGRKISYAVIGIGLNVNQTDFGTLTRAVSLKQITGKSYDIDLLLDRITAEILRVTAQKPSEIFEKYLYFWQKAGEKRGILFEDKPYEGKILFIENDRIGIRHEGEQKIFPVRRVKALL